MTTAVDTSVLIAIAKPEPNASAWIAALAAAHEQGDLTICEVVTAEFFAVLMDREKFHRALTTLGVSYSAISLESAVLAGRLFKQYRREGGPREHLIPDFLIGAHACVQADQLAAIDRGFIRRYFPRLRLITV